MQRSRVEPGGASRWALLPQAPHEVVQALAVPPLWATLLHHRGVSTPAQALAFVREPALGDPFLLPGMQRAVDRLLKAARGSERVAVYGDFDADGVTASALLYSALAQVGADVVPYLPHRTREGHGLSEQAIRHLRTQGVSLIVTVDCGVTASAEVEVANSLGMETIITDHHLPTGPLPQAFAVVTSPLGADPSTELGRAIWPLRYLAGAGLAFKLSHALHLAADRPLPSGLLELAAIGTVADLAPLVGENRALVALGLGALRRSENVGIMALCSVAGIRPGVLDAEALSFGLVPRLNAAGRLDSPAISFNLLTAATTEAALPLAEELERLNHERQQLTGELVAAALPEAEQQATEHSLLFLARREFLAGTNGLVASRLVDQFRRPAVVAAVDGGLAWASARSVPEFNVAEALRRVGARVDGFVRFGGHAAAAGFTAREEALPALAQALRAEAAEALNGVDLTPSLQIDAEVSFRSLLGETFAFLERLGPFGVGNAQPTFLTRGVQLVDVRRVGTAGQHLALKLRSEGAVWNAVAFASRDGREASLLPSSSGQWDVVYTIGRDSREPAGPPRLVLLDYRPSRL